MEREKRMTDRKFMEKSRRVVVEYFNSQADSIDKNGKITEEDIYMVWMCKSLQNWKALLSTDIPDGMYYEVTYNGDKGEMYLDAYKKWKNMVYYVKDDI